jgi:uncharacterized cupin superfamily protein
VPEGVTTTRLDLSTSERQTSLTEALALGSLGARLLSLAPRQRNRIHRHRAQEEVYVVLEGELTIGFEGGEELTLRQWEVARVPPPVRRQLMNRGSRRAKVLALGAAGEHVTGDGEAFTDWSETEGRPPPEVPIPEDLPE